MANIRGHKSLNVEQYIIFIHWQINKTMIIGLIFSNKVNEPKSIQGSRPMRQQAD
jgi:hypothetical protein